MQKIHRAISKKYGLPLPIVERICNSPFKFTINRMREGDDKDILMHYLFKFKRKKYNKRQKSGEIENE